MFEINHSGQPSSVCKVNIKKTAIKQVDVTVNKVCLTERKHLFNNSVINMACEGMDSWQILFYELYK